MLVSSSLETHSQMEEDKMGKSVLFFSSKRVPEDRKEVMRGEAADCVSPQGHKPARGHSDAPSTPGGEVHMCMHMLVLAMACGQDSHSCISMVTGRLLKPSQTSGWRVMESRSWWEWGSAEKLGDSPTVRHPGRVKCEHL